MRSQKGQSMVEFALVLPIFVLVLFGIMDFGRVFHAYLAIDHAGREAAREASIGADDTTIINTAVNNAASVNLTGDQVAITGSKESGSKITITITYPVSFLTPVISNIVSPITLTNSTIMRIE